MKSEQIIAKIRKLGEEIQADVDKDIAPNIVMPAKGLGNVSFDEEKLLLELGDKTMKRSFLNIAHSRKFMQTVMIANLCRKLVESDKHASIREVYYQLKHTIEKSKENTFEGQEESVCPDETLLVRIGSELKLATGREVIDFAEKTGRLVYDDGCKKRWEGVDMKVCAFDESHQVREMDAAMVMKHPSNKVRRVTTASGRSVKVTNCHSLFTCENGLPVPIEVKELKEGSWVALPRKIRISENQEGIDLIKLLIENLPEGELKSIYVRADLEHIAEILARVGNDKLRQFAASYSSTWSNMAANWRHWRTLPLSLLKFSGVGVDDMLEKLAISAKGSSLRYPATIQKDADLGAVFGLLLSEGCHCKYSKRGLHERFVSISNKSPELLSEFTSSFINVFGWEASNAKTLKSKDGTYKINIGANVLGYILEGMGYAAVKSFDKEIPGWLLDAPEGCIKGFLRSFRLGDGSIQESKLRIRYHTSSEKLVDGISFLLLRLGIFPRIYTSSRVQLGHHDAYEIRVNTREYVKLLSDITGDFQYDISRKSLVSGDRIPHMGELLHIARKSCGTLNEGAYKKLSWYQMKENESISRGTLMKAADVLESTSSGCTQLVQLRQIAENDIAWDRVTKIEDAETPEYTLDIAVRPSHSFVGGRGMLLLHNSDPIIEDLERSLDVLREQMNLTADRKGYLYGNIKIVDAGDTINCAKLGRGGYGIPSTVEDLEFAEVKADFALVIETAAMYERLIEEGFAKKNNAILVATQGQAARGVRRLIHRLSNEAKLPVTVFTDGDPYGYYIYSVIKMGSINLAYLSSDLGTPNCKFIGMTMTDIERYGLEKVTEKLKDLDVKRIKEEMGYAWFKDKRWQLELKKMLKGGVRIEQQALANKSLEFVAKKYLPDKISREDFLP
jgi:DNA topoisomerase VI subunit A/intein/homing endonuclease